MAQTHDSPLVFLVDDEEMLLEFAEASLQPLGLRLRKFTDPRLALAAFTEADPKPALLITDFAMKPMTGLELIERCKQLAPDLKSILISGTAAAELSANLPAQVDQFLAKPYRGEHLVGMVKALVGK